MNSCWTKALLTAVAFSAILAADTLRAAEITGTLSPEALKEIAQVEAEIDRIEAETIARDRFDAGAGSIATGRASRQSGPTSRAAWKVDAL